MNYFVANGPAALCHFSDYPYTSFMFGIDVKLHARHQPVGSQLPWATKNQRFIWGPDHYEEIWKAHESWTG
jgi:hypothetical protein